MVMQARKFIGYVEDQIAQYRGEKFSAKDSPEPVQFVGGFTKDARIGLVAQYDHGIRWGVAHSWDLSDTLSGTHPMSKAGLVRGLTTMGFVGYDFGNGQDAGLIETRDFRTITLAQGDLPTLENPDIEIRDLQGMSLDRALGLFIPTYLAQMDKRYGSQDN